MVGLTQHQRLGRIQPWRNTRKTITTSRQIARQKDHRRFEFLYEDKTVLLQMKGVTMAMLESINHPLSQFLRDGIHHGNVIAPRVVGTTKLARDRRLS